MRTLTPLLLLLLLTVQGLHAQNYAKLWKEVENASLADLPRTALERVERIKAKALAERNDAQLLRATLMGLQYGGEMAPDTATARLRRMEEALAAESRPALRALWHSALAQSYLARRSALRGDTAEASLARKHFEASLSEPALLAQTSYKDYLPLFDAGEESRHYGDGLLHILYAAYRDELRPGKAEQARRLTAYLALYRSLGKDEAALLTELELAAVQANGTDNGTRPLAARTDYRTLADIARRYEALPLNVETYIRLTQTDRRAGTDDSGRQRAADDSLLAAVAQKGLSLYGKQPRAALLRNFIARMKQPQASLTTPDGAQPYPGSRHTLTLRCRNLKTLRLLVFKLWDNEIARLNNGREWEKLAKQPRGKATALGIRPAARPAYEWQTIETPLTAPEEPGVYALELWGDGRLLDHATLNVTALQAVVFSGTKDGHRVTVTDRRSGHPVPFAKITRYAAGQDGQWRQAGVYATGADGTAFIPYQTDKGNGRYGGSNYLASTAADKASTTFRLYGRGYSYSAANQPAPAYTAVQLFTDRAIYRPGQRVKFSGVAFTRNGDNYAALRGHETTVYLYNANGKPADSLAVRSDDFGAFGGELQIPARGLTGVYSLRAVSRNTRAYASITVEEYKRPTFTAATQPVATAYALGDTLRVEGAARTFSGVPVSGAKVRWTAVRTALFYRALPAGEEEPRQQGECVTDGEGRFTLPVALTATEEERNGENRTLFRYTISYAVTAENGETAQGGLTLRASNRPAWIEHNLPARICRERIPALRVRQVNAQGAETAADGTYTLLRGSEAVAQGAFRTDAPLALPPLGRLASGQYALALATAAGVRPDTARFVLFSEKDTRPADKEGAFFHYLRTNAAGDSVFVLAGTPRREVVLFYDLVANDSIVESRRFALTDSLLAFPLAYHAEYGDGATAHFAFFHQDRLYHEEASVRRPAPDKRLLLSWATFRSRLVPGGREEWRLRVTHPDGTPAQASLMARLYDASLDALGAGGAPWSLSGISFNRRLPAAYWHATLPDAALSLNGGIPGKWKSYDDLRFAEWKPELFHYAPFGGRTLYESAVIAGGKMRSRGNVVEFAALSLPKNALCDTMTDEGAGEKTKSAGNAQVTTANGKGTEPAAVTPRTNFCETAYFQPALRTDGNGEVSLSFTLPESATQWRFNALAHTALMDCGNADTTAIARKEFMAVPALPRFLRQGDRTVLPVTLQNLTGKDIEAQVEVSLTDALTGRTIYAQRQKVKVAGGKSRVADFPYKAEEAAVLICRATATGGGFSDGEEHYLPVLSSQTEVTRTLPFSLDGRGTIRLRLDTLFNAKGAAHRSLTMEISSNPLWYAVGCLPVLADGTDNRHSATDWAERLYAICIGEKVGKDNPAILNTLNAHPAEADALARLQAEGFTEDTPWLRNAESAARRTAALRALLDGDAAAAGKHTALDRLKELQGADGAWSWYRGMPGNDLITAEVAILLARIEKLTGDNAAHSALTRAFGYLMEKTAKNVERMKETEKKTKKKAAPSELSLRYLYLRTLMGKQPDGDAKFLTERAALLSKQLTMYGKALTAVALAHSGEEEKARLFLQSLLEHTVSGKEMGRWFDTQRAEWSWRSYRIPTQCAAIEALRELDGDGETCREMQLWLLQAKRTQMWETSRATADAVYALLTPAAAQENSLRLTAAAPVYYTLYGSKGEIAGFNAKSQSQTAETAGYFKRQYAIDDCGTGLDRIAVPAEAKVSKTDDGLSWGSVYATCTVPTDEVKNEGKGLTLLRRFERQQPGGGWTALKDGDVLRKGDKVRQVFSLTADRDYDFVEVEAARPACLEPARVLSGYDYNGGLPAYRVARDSRTQYYIEKVRKGSHTFTEELFVDRTGEYASGVATARCVYAPEFGGTASGVRLRGE